MLLSLMDIPPLSHPRRHIAKLLQKEEKDLTSDDMDLGFRICDREWRAQSLKLHANMMIRNWIMKTASRGLSQNMFNSFRMDSQIITTQQLLKSCRLFLPTSTILFHQIPLSNNSVLEEEGDEIRNNI